MFINCLAHIIDCQKSYLNPCEGLHFHTCFSLCFYRTEDMDLIFFLIQFIINRTFLYRKRMAHRNQLGSFFDSHDSRYSCYSENIALLYISCRYCFHDLRSYRNIPCCQSCPVCDLFPGNIDHDCISILVKMCKTLFHIFCCPFCH